jgi:hypothetical protein
MSRCTSLARVDHGRKDFGLETTSNRSGQPSVTDPGSVMQIEDAYIIPEWAKIVVEYLKDGQLPNKR